MAHFRFNKYNAVELQKCGQEFIKAFANSSLKGNKKWSPAVFDWFRDTAASEIRPYPPSSSSQSTSRKGEFMVDLCHTTYPLRNSDHTWPCVAWYEKAFGCPCRIKLALESEWGKWGNGNQSLVMVLDDACKLAVLRADVKIIIFASHWGDARDRIPHAIRDLRRCHGDHAPWLWIDIPNEHKRPLGKPRDIQYGVLR
jgi:hypothetical protein